MRKLHRIFYGFCASLLIAGCAGLETGGNDLRWTEEVKLSDGRVIQVQRTTEIAKHAGFPANRRGLYKAHEICYPPMNIHWKSKGGYRPDIFDIVDGKAYMHVPVSAAAECYAQGSPETGALYFVWDNMAWRRIRREDFPAASQWNLLYDPQETKEEDDAKGLVSLQNKLEQRDKSLHFEQKRLGWKRISDSYARREGCKPFGKGWCADQSCTRLTDEPSNAISMFVKDSSNICQD